ncbi:alkaline phosphatase PafA [Ohtaekwangia sp.]|uniref:alkaline phosphatase PafA n=1 Tax=Ohtaekwangia sp. TaxID=2066019 RepID=UPI002FDD6B3B
MRRVFIIILTLAASTGIKAQTLKVGEQPKLVVGIVVDQMRQEYLYRFYNKFGNDGFRRLIGDGFMVRNAHYNYMPTYTGPGHASIYSGTTPAIHGIIGNDFYNKKSGKTVNCVEDSLQTVVGVASGNGDVSPWRMLSSTVTDELKLFTQKRAKVIGISFKDRGAVLPAGHLADAAYWYDSNSGRFITSSYYMSKLPDWVEKFNGLNLPEKYLAQEWKTLLPIEQYTESGPDDTPYEKKYAGKTKPTFPYNLPELRKQNGNADLLYMTPFANDFLTEFAKTTLVSEKMGKDDISDFLCISYSTTDAIGHAVGPNAIEIEDTYLRLDRAIADLLKTLDKEVGAGNYTLFLTADHGVADVPQYLKDNKMPAGYFNDNYAEAKLNEFLANYFPGKKLIANVSNDQIFLNHEAFQGSPKSSGLDMFIVAELVGKYLMSLDGVANYYTEGVLRQGNYNDEGIKGRVIRGYNPKRSGDIVFVLEPGWFGSGSIQGTTHGSPYTYDTNVPMLFYGKGIRKGFSVEYHPITDIAPTISTILNIKFPSGCTGEPVAEVFPE